MNEPAVEGPAALPQTGASGGVAGTDELAQGLQRVLDEYLPASQERVNDHPLAIFIRQGLKSLVTSRLGTSANALVVKGSSGQGGWARGPWVGIFDPIITTSAQMGYYCCFLFREDMKGVYLTLVQAMTEARLAYRSDAKTALRARAENFRAVIGPHIGDFDLKQIDLAPSHPANDTAFYEAGTVCAKFYPTGRIPNDVLLSADIATIISLYTRLATSEMSLS